ncbi:MAG: LCP family protein, partial [Planctomycetaceae bacterium]
APEITPQATTVNELGTPIAPNVPLQQVSGPPPVTWDGKSRVTVLLIGLDYRDWLNGDYPRSDTMILLTIDPVSKTAGMLSIPRDMWVNIPNYGYFKINTAYYLGAANKLPGRRPSGSTPGWWLPFPWPWGYPSITCITKEPSPPGRAAGWPCWETW